MRTNIFITIGLHPHGSSHVVMSITRLHSVFVGGVHCIERPITSASLCYIRLLIFECSVPDC